MSFSDFMNATKTEVGTIKYAAASNLLGADGQPLMWTIRPLKTAEIESLRRLSTRKIKDPKTGIMVPEFDSEKFETSIIIKAIVEPDLTNKDLQDRFKCMDPASLLMTLVDIPGDYAELIRRVNEMTKAASPDINDLVDDAKN